MHLILVGTEGLEDVLLWTSVEVGCRAYGRPLERRAPGRSSATTAGHSRTSFRHGIIEELLFPQYEKSPCQPSAEVIMRHRRPPALHEVDERLEYVDFNEAEQLKEMACDPRSIVLQDSAIEP